MAQEAREYAESIVDTVREPLLVLDADLRVISASRPFYETFKVTPEETEGQLLYDLGNRQWDIPALRKLLEKILPENTSIEGYEVEHDFADIGQKTMLLNARRISLQANKTQTVLLAIEDITERKRAEEELGQYRDRLEELVEGRTAELARAIEDLEREVTERKQAEERLKRTLEDLARSNRELEQFAYVASHDLQEPLRMVASFTQLLAKRYQGKLDADADDFIGYAVEGANRMQKLIQDLLSYSRLGTQGKEFQPTNCETVLDKALENLQAAIEETGAVITHDPLPTVMADEAQLLQLFQNLLSNAIKFHGEESPRVHVSAEEKDGNWVFSVKDNGIGMDPKYFELVFVIFQRLQARDEYPGTGIGLAITKRIVHRHGGKIWAESEPGKGSTFFFTIPIVRR